LLNNAAFYVVIKQFIDNKAWVSIPVGDNDWPWPPLEELRKDCTRHLLRHGGRLLEDEEEEEEEEEKPHMVVTWNEPDCDDWRMIFLSWGDEKQEREEKSVIYFDGSRKTACTINGAVHDVLAQAQRLLDTVQVKRQQDQHRKLCKWIQRKNVCFPPRTKCVG
jgi:hypothetical protein